MQKNLEKYFVIEKGQTIRPTRNLLTMYNSFVGCLTSAIVLHYGMMETILTWTNCINYKNERPEL